MSDSKLGEFGSGCDGPVAKQSIAHGQDLQLIGKTLKVELRLRNGAVGDAAAECRGNCDLCRRIAGQRRAGGVQEDLVNGGQSVEEDRMPMNSAATPSPTAP